MNMPNLASCHHFMRRCWSGVGASPEGSRPGGGWAEAGLAARTADAAAAASKAPRRSTEKSDMHPSQRRGSWRPRLWKRLTHIHGGEIEVEHGFLLLEVRLVELTHTDHLAHDLGVKAGALGLAIDFLDVGAERGFLLFKPLDAVDEGLELVFGEAGFGHGKPDISKAGETSPRGSAGAMRGLIC